uniref:Uncharacterized protein n=1 Tax=Rhizobium meliloti TaxID=382 RepID=A0A0D4DCW3_RHIML|nr:hypothetical protein [Sinorhizobium meliloti]
MKMSMKFRGAWPETIRQAYQLSSLDDFLELRGFGPLHPGLQMLPPMFPEVAWPSAHGSPFY